MGLVSAQPCLGRHQPRWARLVATEGWRTPSQRVVATRSLPGLSGSFRHGCISGRDQPGPAQIYSRVESFQITLGGIVLPRLVAKEFANLLLQQGAPIGAGVAPGKVAQRQGPFIR